MSTSTHTNEFLYPDTNISQEIVQQWKSFMTGGVISAILGLLAIIFPIAASITVSLFLGWLLMIAGVAQSIHAFRVKKWNGFALTLITGILALAVGAALVLYPVSGVAALTLLVAGFLFASGIFRSLTALRIRPFDHWGSLLASGVLAIILALLVIFQFPFSAAWFIGLLVGIDLLFSGLWLMTIAWNAKRTANG